MSYKQKVAYFTVGWNRNGVLVPVPVLAKGDSNGLLKPESLVKTALDRQCSILLVNPEDFNLDPNGNEVIDDKDYFICSNSVVALNSKTANDAINDIMFRIGLRIGKESLQYKAKNLNSFLGQAWQRMINEEEE